MGLQRDRFAEGFGHGVAVGGDVGHLAAGQPVFDREGNGQHDQEDVSECVHRKTAPLAVGGTA